MGKIKSWVIVIGLIGIFVLVLFAGKKVTKYQNEISSLKGANSILADRIRGNVKVIARERASNDSLKKEISILKKDFNILAWEKQKIILERDDLLAKLQTITTDSSYRFLQEVAYNYPGVLKYLFNELQVRGIHADYIKLQSSEQVNRTLESQLNNCGRQVEKYEKITTGLENIVGTQNANIIDYKNIIKNDSTIIKDQEKTAKKERHRKNFWRTTTGVGILVIIGLII